MKESNEILLEIMRDRNLSTAQVALMLNRKRQTVYQWRAGAQSMPAHMIDLLRLKIAAQERAA